MRTFVATFRKHLVACGVTDDDETIWQWLRRFQILEFEFEASAPLSRSWGLHMAQAVLEGSDTARAGALWGNLVEIALSQRGRLVGSWGSRLPNKTEAGPRRLRKNAWSGVPPSTVRLYSASLHRTIASDVPAPEA